MDTITSKSALRDTILARRKATPDPVADSTIIERLKASSIYNQSKILMLYVSFGTEINTHGLICDALESGKKIYIPKCNPETHQLSLHRIRNITSDLSPGHYGILEPTTPADVSANPDCIIVPGMVFTFEGHRLGYGGGYYDRFLATLSPRCHTIGLIRDTFIFPTLPIDPYDIPVDYIYTQSQIINCKEVRRGH